MLKDLNKEKGGKSGKKKEQHSKLMEKDVPVPETDNVEEDINLHCVDRTVRELEFIMVRRKLMRFRRERESEDRRKKMRIFY